MALTDPKLFYFSPDTAHLLLAGCDVVKTLEKHKQRLMLADYKDAKTLATPSPTASTARASSIWATATSIFRLPSRLEVDFFQGWLIVDLDIARQGPRASYERSSAYVVSKLDPVYA